MLDPSQQQQQHHAANNIKSSFSVTEENRHYLKVFIQTYHNLPILWDTTLRDYTNRDKRAEAYQQLVPIYKYLKRDANLQDVKKKINTLRTNYRKELKIIESARRQGTTYQPRCWTFYELDFLRNAEKFLAVDPNYIKSETSNSSASSAFGIFNEATHQGNFLEISPYGFRMNNGGSPPPSITQMFQKSFGQSGSNNASPQKAPGGNLNNSLNPLNVGMTNEMGNSGNNLNEYGQQMQQHHQQQSPHNQQQPSPSSEINKRQRTSMNTFNPTTNNASASTCNCLSSQYPEEESLTRTWAYKLKRLPRDQRLFAEKFINDILFEAESGTLHRGSMQINAFEPYVRFEESQGDDNTSSTSAHDKSQSPQVPLSHGHSTNSQSHDMADIKSGIDIHDNAAVPPSVDNENSGSKGTNAEFNNSYT
ncbi:uncharacterized protein LOC106082932 [Stomoxys calcitrans]|uniref:uncharacterized protein LOC106082932 n=1 Tax=Stomoxys calcitrans TaxID=35570 RepID=UPI0027E327C0|nr:uncharacterized protein LOC106082932 [Stomoxys calcitrans]